MKITEQNWREKLDEENVKSFKQFHEDSKPIGDLVCMKAVEKVIQSLITSIKQEAKQEERKAMSWIVGVDTGASSETIWSVMMGVERTHVSVPYDAADYGRCYRLLKKIPEWIPRLHEVSDKYPQWDEHIKHIQSLTEEDVTNSK